MPIAMDFSDERNRLTTIERFVAGQRRKTICFAVGIHLLVTLILAFPLSFFDFSQREEIYTVNLFETAELQPVRGTQPAPPPPPAKKIEAPKVKTPPVQKPVEKPIEKPVEKPVIKEPITEPVVPEPTPEPVVAETTEPAEVISLKPREVKKDLKPKKTETEVKKSEPKAEPKLDPKKVDQALARIKENLNRQKELQRQREQEAQAAIAADEAVARLREAIHAQQGGRGTTDSAGAAGAGSSELDAALKLYYIAVSNKIHENWILPALQDWKNDLKAVVVVHVQRDGTVSDHYFEEKSENPYFDQFVEKTLKLSLPLPPFPPGIKEDSLEIGLVFRPSGLE